jgi:hypothetical protein
MDSARLTGSDQIQGKATSVRNRHSSMLVVEAVHVPAML